MSAADALRCDVAIIGAGTAGLAAERAARGNGASTLLIDPEFGGTTCATVGCMPSKLLIAAANARRAALRARLFGIRVGEVAVDDDQVLGRIRAERDRFVTLTKRSIDDIPDAVRLTGRAKFESPGALVLDDGRRIEARAIVIATGSRPALPDAYANLGDRALTNETVFELKSLPQRLAVVGAGAIGLEMAQAFARLGVKVALFDSARTMARLRCPRVHKALHSLLAKDIDLHLGVEAKPEKREHGVSLCWSGASEGEAMFDKVLVAAGRRPVLDSLNIANAGLTLDDHGVPCHERDTMRCGDSNVFMAGDVADDQPLLHEASHDGSIAGRNAAAWPVPIRVERQVPFSIIFTDPQVVRIGQAETDSAVSGTTDFEDQGRARLEARNEGALTLYAAAPEGKLIGADLIAPAGEHLGHLLAWVIQQKMTATQVLQLPFYHPTIEEGLKHALRMVCAATPIPLPETQDAGSPAGA